MFDHEVKHYWFVKRVTVFYTVGFYHRKFVVGKKWMLGNVDRWVDRYLSTIDLDS